LSNLTVAISHLRFLARAALGASTGTVNARWGMSTCRMARRLLGSERVLR
jgi:hypothetical protein